MTLNAMFKKFFMFFYKYSCGYFISGRGKKRVKTAKYPNVRLLFLNNCRQVGATNFNPDLPYPVNDALSE